MEANKDGGTSVGFSNFMQHVCTKHEWIERTMTITGGHTSKSIVCGRCGISKPLIDFKIPENLEQINKQEWEDIWNEYFKSDKCGNKFPTLFFHWLKENYTAPEKK